MAEDKLKFLEFIQNIITRMNTNSFQIKAMCVAIISAIFAVYATNGNKAIFYVSLVVLGLCWVFDAYYLCQEKKFRALYDEVRKEDSKVQMFDLSAFKNYHKDCCDCFKAWFSKTILYFYALLGVCIFVLKEIL